MPSSPRGPAHDLDAAAAAAAAESLSSLSGLHAAPPWEQQPSASGQVYVDVDIHVSQRSMATDNGAAQTYDQSLIGPQMFDHGKVSDRSSLIQVT